MSRGSQRFVDRLDYFKWWRREAAVVGFTSGTEETLKTVQKKKKFCPFVVQCFIDEEKIVFLELMLSTLNLE